MTLCWCKIKVNWRHEALRVIITINFIICGSNIIILSGVLDIIDLPGLCLINASSLKLPWMVACGPDRAQYIFWGFNLFSGSAQPSTIYQRNLILFGHFLGHCFCWCCSAMRVLKRHTCPLWFAITILCDFLSGLKSRNFCFLFEWEFSNLTFRFFPPSSIGRNWTREYLIHRPPKWRNEKLSTWPFLPTIQSIVID